MRIETKIGLVSLSVIIIAAACGGRSGTEIFGYEDRLTDAGGGGAGGSGGYGGGIVGGAGGTTAGAGGGTSGTGATGGGGSGGDTPDADVPDVSVDAPPPDAASDAKDFFDTLPPIPDGALGDCVACLEEECGEEINACYNDPTCVEGIQCTVTECLAGGGGGGAGGGGGGGGGIDFQCVLGCFDNDMGSAMTALAVFQCVTQSCGEDCGMGSGGAGGGSAFGEMNGMNLPPSLFGDYHPGAVGRRGHYIGTTRVPRPEEVASAYPWLAEVLAGRMPDPPPPCIVKKRANP